MNIRKKDISAHRNHAGAWVLSTLYDGYFKSAVFYDMPLKWARVEFIDSLKKGTKK